MHSFIRPFRYRNRKVNKNKQVLAVPMPPVLKAVETLMDHPDFLRYAELLELHHRSELPPKRVSPDASVLRSRRLVETLTRQVCMLAGWLVSYSLVD